MKKIILTLSLVFIVSSCGTVNNNVNENTNKVENQNISNVTQDVNNGAVELSPDEEKMIDDLLNF
jgi:uncharacterized protein YceK